MNHFTDAKHSRDHLTAFEAQVSNKYDLQIKQMQTFLLVAMTFGLNNPCFFDVLLLKAFHYVL